LGKGAAAHQIEDLLVCAERERRDDAVDDVVDVRKVAPRRAMAIDLQDAAANGSGQGMDRGGAGGTSANGGAGGGGRRARAP